MELLKEGALRWGIALDASQMRAFEAYREWLLKWNERFNLTRITGPEEVEVRHFLDSLSCLLVLEDLTPRARVIDVGSGAGFPGVPLKIVLSGLELGLLEANSKKVEFLEALVGALDLAPVEVIQARAEEAGQHPDYREQYDIALARAVAPLSVLLEYALPLVRVGGGFVALRGAKAPAELAGAASALKQLGGEEGEIQAVQLPGLEEIRYVVRVKKAAPTPARYPRRPGIPRKRPL